MTPTNREELIALMNEVNGQPIGNDFMLDHLTSNGLAVVPVEATNEMRGAIHNCDYKAMIAVSPFVEKTNAYAARSSQ